MNRAVNLVSVTASYLLSGMLRRPVHRGMPVAFSVEPTTRCNLRCPECPTGQRRLTRAGGDMDPALYRSVIDALSPSAYYLTLYFQGEPYLHREFIEMVRYAKSKKLYVATSTNGHFLTRETALETVRSGLDRLIVSLDGATQESYSTYRTGGSLEQVIGGLHRLREAKEELRSRRPRVVLQCLLLNSNRQERGQIREIGHRVKADGVEFKTAQFNNFEHGNPLMPEWKDSRYKRVRSSGDSATGPSRYAVRNPLPNRCFRMWSSCVVTWDGDVLPCCFDKEGQHVMGNIAEEPFHEIWRNERYESFRSMILTDRKSTEICRNCTQLF